MSAAASTEETILEAARKVFMQKGFAAARMCEIAKIAGINQALLHYYFRSKERLFARIFREEFAHLFASIGAIIQQDLPLKEKIRQIVKVDLEKLMSMTELPMFIMSELYRNPEIILKDLDNVPIKKITSRLEEDINAEVKAGLIRYMDAKELMINIQSLTIYPILAKPLLIHRMGHTEKSFNQLMEKRKNDIVEFIWNSIKV